jgi:hypothetical protein
MCKTRPTAAGRSPTLFCGRARVADNLESGGHAAGLGAPQDDPTRRNGFANLDWLPGGPAPGEWDRHYPRLADSLRRVPCPAPTLVEGPSTVAVK